MNVLKLIWTIDGSEDVSKWKYQGISAVALLSKSVVAK